MKIKIRVNDEETNKKIRLTLFLPTFLIKSNIIWKNIKTINDDYQVLQSSVRKGYQALKEYIKKEGHFNLIEVNSKDAYIIIRV